MSCELESEIASISQMKNHTLVLLKI